MIKKFKLSNFSAIIILLAADLGIGYFTLPYVFSGEYLWSSVLLIFNCLCGLFSCYLLIQTCELTKLQSIHEFFFVFSGGRAGIILSCTAIIIYYTFITLFFMNQAHLCMDYLADQILIACGYDMKRDGNNDEGMDIVVTILIALVLYPLCIIKEFHRVKIMGFIICIFNVGILLTILGYLIALGPSWYQRNVKSDGNFLLSTSVFNSAPEFCFTFHFQIYFLIVIQYLGHKKKVFNSYVAAGVTNISVLAFCFIYCLLCLSTNIVFTDFREVIQREFDVYANKILVNTILLIVTSLQIPFKFFLEKEFLFIIYGELRYGNVSLKIQEMQKQFFTSQQPYTQLSIKKVSNSEYQIVREPYLKLSNKEYLSLTSAIFFLNLLMLFLFKTEYLQQSDSSSPHSHKSSLSQGQVIVFLSQVSAACLQPMVVYGASGYFYYQVSLRLEINPKMRRVAYWFHCLGYIFAFVYTWIIILNIWNKQVSQ